MDFKQPYNHQTFLHFLQHNFLPDDFEILEEDIDINFKTQFIKKAIFLGRVNSLGLNVYEAYHHSENDPRVSLSSEIFRLLADYGVRRALVIFISSKSSNYRFSLVTIDLKWEKGKQIKKEYSNPRRYSFYLGPDAKVHTPYQFLVNKGKIKNLDDLFLRFNVEVVTKEFFSKYRLLFEKLLNYLIKDNAFKIFAQKNNISIENFAKKLLGQIVFIYFLQRKGWLGARREDRINEGNKDFLRHLFDKSKLENKNFFNSYLEPLFYNALNSKSKYAANFYRDYFDCQIPFLNGGLFEPLNNYDWENEFIHLPDKLFSNDPKNPEKDGGILDIFDLYNFTVAEDDPVDKEVSIDPEMLGKVFENLLEENLRKGKGTYYTPREIVHYMCRESLINYLATEVNLIPEDVRNKYFPPYNVLGDKKFEARDVSVSEKIIESLKNIKVVDPACGSGAFLVGMLQQITQLRHELETRSKLLGRRKITSTEYEIKKESIQNCIYGVDIDSGAVEIAKLRLWLSLVVDYELDQIEPLPNLDYKIMVGNSLIELLPGGLEVKKIKDAADWDRNELIAKLNEAKQSYFNLSDYVDKKTYRNDINKLIQKIINYDREKKTQSIWDQILANRGQTTLFGRKNAQSTLVEAEKKLSAQLEELKQIKEFQSTDHFEWYLNFIEVFREKGGFDVLIANPPYVKEYVNKSAFDGLRNSPYYQGKMDLWYVFTCRGIDLLKNTGVLCFIAQNNWVTSYGASKMRNKIIKDAQILSLIDFGEYKIFEAGIQTMLMVFKKDVSLESYPFDYRRLQGNDLVFDDILALLSKSSNSNAEYLNPKISRTSFIDKKFTFSNSGVESILEKLVSRANFHLDPVKEVAQGIVCPQDYVIKSSLEILGGHFKIGDGIFVLSDKEVKTIGFSKKELTLIKPFYTTNEFQRWYGNPANKKWVIYTDSSFRNKKKIEDYPSIKTHLDQFKKVITSDSKPYGLHRARDEHFFIGEKVIAVRKCTKPTFTYTDFDTYVSATFYVIKTERVSQKYLAGLLNSSLIAFWLKHRGKMQGNNYQIDKEPIIDLPILKPSQLEQKAVINTVDQIIKIIKTDNKNPKVYELEKQINQLVYNLYGLTPEEIEIVEGNKYL